MDNQLTRNDGTKNHGYSTEKLIEMRKKGLPKPPEVTWHEWQQPFKINDKHEVIAFMAACGKNSKDIAEETGMTYQRVRVLIKSERVSFRIQELQYQLFGKNQQRRFEALSTKAVDTLSQLVTDEKEKGSTRLQAAREILDRAMGKPRQTIEHQNSKLSSIYDKLDDILGSQGKPKPPEVIEDVSYTEVEEEERPKKKPAEKKIAEEEEVDKFFEEFYGEEKEE